jgi:CheY-like chemotaxis protein
VASITKTILLIDDSEIFRKGLSRILEEDGYVVLQAIDGMQGVEAAAQFKPDLIITDIEMPVMNGVEATRRIRRQLELSIPIIALSSHPAEEMKAHAMEVGCTEYLCKPFDLDQFRDLLAELLRQQA